MVQHFPIAGRLQALFVAVASEAATLETGIRPDAAMYRAVGTRTMGRFHGDTYATVAVQRRGLLGLERPVRQVPSHPADLRR